MGGRGGGGGGGEEGGGGSTEGGGAVCLCPLIYSFMYASVPLYVCHKKVEEDQLKEEGLYMRGQRHTYI